MANVRELDKRRKSIRNIRKITRTMELIATARFKKAMDRAVAATAYTQRMTEMVAELASSGAELSHPLLLPREKTGRALLLVLTANRGFSGGFNTSIVRQSTPVREQLATGFENLDDEVAGKRGLTIYKARRLPVTKSYLQFNDQPSFDDVQKIADEYLSRYLAGEIDRVDVAYMRFVTVARQVPTVETLLPLGSLAPTTGKKDAGTKSAAGASSGRLTEYEFYPSAESILEELVPQSFRIRLFKCFLDNAVSEQIARMVSMKSATENASQMISALSMRYNRARQAKITGEIMEIIGGVEALAK
jgi:F-type H+-transporting ATPase subunit gamma